MQPRRLVLRRFSRDCEPRTGHEDGLKYISTRGTAPVLDFSDALLAGLARDGGL